MRNVVAVEFIGDRAKTRVHWLVSDGKTACGRSTDGMATPATRLRLRLFPPHATCNACLLAGRSDRR